jgi:hypothetical protein
MVSLLNEDLETNRMMRGDKLQSVELRERLARVPYMRDGKDSRFPLQRS